MRKVLLSCLVAVCLFLSSCGYRSNEKVEDSADTLIVEDESEQDINPYPAVQFPSLESLKYEVNVFASVST